MRALVWFALLGAASPTSLYLAMTIKVSIYLGFINLPARAQGQNMQSPQYEHEFLSHELIYNTSPPKLPQVMGKIMLLELFWI